MSSKRFEFDESSIKSYNEESDEIYSLEVNEKYIENLHNLLNDFPFFSERIEIEKFEKLVAELHDKTEYAIHIGNLKQILFHRLALKKDPRKHEKTFPLTVFRSIDI